MAGYPAAIAESEMYISQLLFTIALDTSHKPVASGHHTTGHSKFHNTFNHPPPATDSSRTARTPSPLFFLSWREEPVKAGTCAHDRRALQQLALNVHVKHSDLT